MKASDNAPYLHLKDDALLGQCEVDHYRSGGPGGQKRNKTSSAVRLRHQPTGLSVTASEHRSQHVNLVYALRRLRESIALNVRGPLDLGAYEPTDCLSECLSPDGSLRVSERDPRYYVAFQEVLDVLAACDMVVSATAEILHLSTGQTIKLLRADEKVWGRVNQLRRAAGLKALR